MAITVLSQASALNPGSDLWIVADLESSPWTLKMDWYLNFQITKNHRHMTPEMPAPLLDILRRAEIPSFQESFSTDSKNLMLSSEKYLPCKWIVIIPWQNDLSKWTLEFTKVWEQLGSPTLRVFTPPGFSTAQLEKACPTNIAVQDFTAVLD